MSDEQKVSDRETPPQKGETLRCAATDLTYTITEYHGSGPHTLLNRTIEGEHYTVRWREYDSEQRLSIVQMYSDTYVKGAGDFPVGVADEAGNLIAGFGTLAALETLTAPQAVNLFESVRGNMDCFIGTIRLRFGRALDRERRNALRFMEDATANPSPSIPDIPERSGFEAVLNAPRFDGEDVGNMDWRYHVPEIIRHAWGDLTPAARGAVYLMARKAAEVVAAPGY